MKNNMKDVVSLREQFGKNYTCEMETYDFNVFESRRSNKNSILSQNDLDNQTENFRNFLISIGYNISMGYTMCHSIVFMSDYYQNMNTTMENLKEFKKFLRENLKHE